VAGDIFMSLFAPAIEVGAIRPTRMAQRCRMPRRDGVVLAPCHQLRVYPQDRTWHQFPGLFSTLSKELKRTTATPETAPSLAECQIVDSRTFSRTELLWARYHRAKAKQ
jgi:hypothetical protein